jgi:hypothetical protein
MALIVFGVVRQQPPTREAPTSHHLSTYETKSSSETPVCCCNKIKAEAALLWGLHKNKIQSVFPNFHCIWFENHQEKQEADHDVINH